MALIVDVVSKGYDLSKIKNGTLVYAKHKSWTEGKAGFVAEALKNRLTVQYLPEIGNGKNHFFLPVSEVADGEWLVRWSEDLGDVYEYTAKGGA